MTQKIYSLESPNVQRTVVLFEGKPVGLTIYAEEGDPGIILAIDWDRSNAIGGTRHVFYRGKVEFLEMNPFDSNYQGPYWDQDELRKRAVEL